MIIKELDRDLAPKNLYAKFRLNRSNSQVVWRSHTQTNPHAQTEFFPPSFLRKNTSLASLAHPTSYGVISRVCSVIVRLGASQGQELKLRVLSAVGVTSHDVTSESAVSRPADSQLVAIVELLWRRRRWTGQVCVALQASWRWTRVHVKQLHNIYRVITHHYKVIYSGFDYITRRKHDVNNRVSSWFPVVFCN